MTSLIRACTSLVAVLSLASSSLASAGSLPRAKDLRIPIYVNDSPAPAALLSMGELRQESQRRGFLRIGLLPLWVGDGVQIEVPTLSGIHEIIKRISSWRPKKEDTRAMEWRRFTVTLTTRHQPILEAACVRAMSDGNLRLTRGVKLRPASRTIEGTDAIWYLNGPHAGEVRMSDGTLVDLFNSSPTLIWPEGIDRMASPQPNTTPTPP